MYNTIFFIIITIIIVEFIFSNILSFIDLKYQKTKLPNELNDIFSAEEFLKSQNYKKTNTKFSYLTSAFNLILILAMLISGGFGIVENIAKSISSNQIIISLLFFAIIALAADILSLPFSIYATFVIEEKFGFNKTTVKTFIFDKIKSWLLMAILGGGILSLIIWFYMQTQEMFWIYTWLLISLFSVFFSIFYSNLIVPLFNKQTPLPEGELKNEIENFANKTGFHLDNIYQIDGSKRSSKANAYFTGLGRKKRIVLYDTLIEKLTPKEIVAVLAHEIGHYKKKHTIIGLITSIIQTGIILFIFSFFVDNPELSKALGAEQAAFYLGLIAFSFLWSPISTITGIFMNIISRKNEYQADLFASQNFDGNLLINALKKLSSTNLSNLTPHPFVVFCTYSHPTLLQRIRFIKNNTYKSE